MFVLIVIIVLNTLDDMSTHKHTQPTTNPHPLMRTHTHINRGLGVTDVNKLCSFGCSLSEDTVSGMVEQSGVKRHHFEVQNR